MSKTELITEPNSPRLIVRRAFNAPAKLVFRAHVEPELIKRWLGPAKYATEVETLDASHGGQYRFLHRDDEGNEFAFRGLFHGTPSVDEGITQTWEWEGLPGHVSLQKMTFEETADGQTIVHSDVVFQSAEDRDGHIAAGMEGGMNEGYDRLDALLIEL
ncbi:polyketide cyclase [Pseudonocardiaceae bacterium YIM PH 21723]|nr:polyketide cyclase [Pseudonocardiaceae bacterium YIM PH 21723]